MGIYVSVTPEGTVSYPMHRHGEFEVMYYFEGTGYMRTEKGNVAFEPGTVIIVPPGIMHGSVSENGFANISVGGDFSGLFMFSSVVRLSDGSDGQAKTLAELIVKNRHGGKEYLSALCVAYATFLLQRTECETPIDQKISSVIAEMEKRYADKNFSVTETLKKSGYAEDYIRAEFKKRSGRTPVGMLRWIRIERAKSLLEIYAGSRSIAEIADACGFDDVTYFSKKFKEACGISPDGYRKKHAL